MFEKFSSCAQWKVLMARVIYYDDNGVPCIELIDTNTEEVSCILNNCSSWDLI